MARPSNPPIDEQRLRLLYDRFQSVRKVATLLNCNKEHVRSEMKRIGITKVVTSKLGGSSVLDLDMIRLKPAMVDVRDYGTVATWIRDNPTRKLPRSAQGIADTIGVTPNAVRTYFYRLRKKMVAKLESLPDVSKLDLEMIDVLGEAQPTQEFISYSYRVDYYSMFVMLQAVMPDGATAVFEIADLLSFERVLEDAVQAMSLEDRAVLLRDQIALRDQRALRKGRRSLTSNHHGLQTRML